MVLRRVGSAGFGMRFTLPGVPSITHRCEPSSAADRAAVPTDSASSEDEPTNVEVRWRPDDGDEVAGSFDEFDANLLKSSVPWRVFRWRKGQRHYSGSYWSSTMDAHVIYESRLELSRLIFADFDRSVSRIFAQPFILAANVGCKRRRHIPDYLLMADDGPIVVDVKPAAQLARPKVAETLAWTQQVVDARGWRYEVWTEPSTVELENIRFLGGYRRAWLFRPEILEQLSDLDLDGLTIGEVMALRHEIPAALVQSSVFHLLWRQVYTTDLSRPLSSRHVLRSTA